MSKRVIQATPEIIAYLRAMDKTDNYVSGQATDGELSLIDEYASALPGDFRDILGEKLAAIVFIENFTGGGMTDLLIGADGSPFVILFLNPATLRSPLGAWISSRDESSFEAIPGFAIANSLGDDRFALLHTLTHEACHIQDFYRRVTPYVYPGYPGKRASPTAFTASVWREYAKPARAYDFQGRSGLSAYGLGQRREAAAAADLYRALVGTPFVSLYGSASWAEDYAETFTWFYLKERFSIEYAPKVILDVRVLYEFYPLRNPLSASRYGALREVMAFPAEAL